MTTPPLNDLQRLVVKHFGNGDYQQHECHIPGDTGDTLFDFVMGEADQDCIEEAAEKEIAPIFLLLARLQLAAWNLQTLHQRISKELK